MASRDSHAADNDSDSDFRSENRAMARDISATMRAVESMVDGVSGIRLLVNTLSTKAETQAAELHHLSVLLRDGNGAQQSVMTRLALLENGVDQLGKIRTTETALPTKIVGIEGSIKTLDDQIKTLKDAGLPAKVTTVEGSIKTLEDQLKTMKEAAVKRADHQAASHDAGRLSRATLWASVLGGIVSVVGAIIAAVITIKHGP